jgi:hypothetical protein
MLDGMLDGSNCEFGRFAASQTVTASTLIAD